jgi:glycosyltransferase involved in cell wall biosynthesis
MSIRLSIVVPCFNEAEVLAETSTRLLELVDSLRTSGLVNDRSDIVFVDDGSGDKTWELITTLAAGNPRIHGVKLSRNFGHQSALLAGLFSTDSDAVVSVDADLQDDLAAIEEMVQRHREGCDIVYGVRRSRRSDTWFKRTSAELYYTLLRALGVDVVFNHADFRLMSRRAIDYLRRFPETNLFLRGLIPLIGLPTTTVLYDRAARFAGTSKYPLRRMITLALNGITSFSVVPLRLITILGFIVFLVSLAMIGWVLLGTLIFNTTIPGWASSVIPIYLLGGLQLLAIGVLGEYVAKIYLETKRRPSFFIQETI